MKNNSIEIAKELGITLKKVSSFRGHEGMLGINADICLNGKVIAHAYDDASGGCLDIRPEGYTKENREAIEMLEDKIGKFPEYDLNIDKQLGKEPRMVKHTFDDIVNALADEVLLAKAKQKALKKDEKKGIVYEENGKSMLSSWKRHTLDTLVKHPQGLGTLQAAYMGLKIKKGVTILNVEYLKKVGVKI